ncbi:acyltransferase [Methanothrix sp.]|uniref:acyltransferase n=1 Tax=Methanothrix sp. TaxID=90426 RepID=UPI0032AF3A28
MNLKAFLLLKLGFSRRRFMEAYLDGFRKRGVKIGKNVSMYGTTIDGHHPEMIRIGDNCNITGGTILLTHDSGPTVFGKPMKVGPITIHDNVFIGMDTVVLPGVEIGPNAVVGANAVVTHDIPPNSIAAGVPARVIMSLDEYLAKF